MGLPNLNLAFAGPAMKFLLSFIFFCQICFQFPKANAKFSRHSSRHRLLAFGNESALILLLIMIIHRRIVKQIVQLEFVFVWLWRTASWSAPEAIKVGEMIAATFNVTFAWHLKSKGILFRNLHWDICITGITCRNRSFCMTWRSKSFKYSESPSCQLQVREINFVSFSFDPANSFGTQILPTFIDFILRDVGRREWNWSVVATFGKQGNKFNATTYKRCSWWLFDGWNFRFWFGRHHLDWLERVQLAIALLRKSIMRSFPRWLLNRFIEIHSIIFLRLGRTTWSKNRVFNLFYTLAWTSITTGQRLLLVFWRRILLGQTFRVHVIVHWTKRILGCPSHRLHEIVSNIFRVTPWSATGTLKKNFKWRLKLC